MKNETMKKKLTERRERAVRIMTRRQEKHEEGLKQYREEIEFCDRLIADLDKPEQMV